MFAADGATDGPMQTTRPRLRAPDYLDLCARCGDAIDEPLGRIGRRAAVCRRCALLLDDLRSPVHVADIVREVLRDLQRRRRSS